MVRTYLRKIKSTLFTLSQLKVIHKESGKNYFFLLNDYLSLKKRKGLNIEEYYQYEFEKRDNTFKNNYLGVNEKRFYLDLLNPKKYYTIARNKYFSHLFLANSGIRKANLYCYYNPEFTVIHHNIANNRESVIRILQSQNVQTCVIKPLEGTHGMGIMVIHSIEWLGPDECIFHRYDGNTVKLSDLLSYQPLLFEEVIRQTRQFADFNSSSINTIRLITTLYPDGNVQIASAWIRIGKKGNCVDNAGDGGNISIAIDENTGKLYNATLFNAWRRTVPLETHPDSHIPLNGMIINNWETIKEDVFNFHRSLPFLKAIAWDVAITDQGPVIIEINDFWDATGQLFCEKNRRKEIRACYRAWKELEDKGLVRYPFERQNNPLSVRKLNKIVNLE